MKKVLWFIPITFIYLVVSQSCQNRTSVAGGTDSLNNAKADSAAMARQRDEYRFAVQQQLNKVQEKLDSLDARMKSESKNKAKEDWQKSKNDLQRDINRINADLKAYGNKVAPDWQNFKTKVNRSLDTLGNNLERALRPSGTDTSRHHKGRVQKK